MKWDQFVNWVYRKTVPDNYRTVTAFMEGKQTTFICGYCGNPFPAHCFEKVKLDHYSPKRNKKLLPLFFSIFRKQWIKGVGIYLQTQHFNKICDRTGEEMVCPKCNTSTYMNIIIIKIMKINIGVVL